MSQWLALLLALLRGVQSLADYGRERQWLRAGEAQALADQLRKQADDVQKAEDARDKARRAADAVPDGRGLPDDGFRRD